MADQTNNGETANWEVVSVTDSVHAAAPGPHGPGSFDEAKEKAPPSDAMFMSGHFSLSQKTELETILMASDSKSSSIDANSFEPELPNQSYEEKTKDDLDDISWMEPKFYSSSELNEEEREVREEREERKEIEKSESDESEWWKKVGLFYRKVKGEKMFVVFVAATALVGVAILSRKLQREKLQLQKFKFQLNFSNEGMSSIVAGPLNKIKAVFLTDNQHRAANNLSYGDFTS